MTYYWGTTKISNPKTLQRWIDLGWYDSQIRQGYTFNVGCGRFIMTEKCTCTKCRNRTRPELVKVLKDNGL